MALIVQEGEGEDEVNLGQSFESNPVAQEEFGESGEEGQEVKVGKSEVNRPLNRFQNITACKHCQTNFALSMLFI